MAYGPGSAPIPGQVTPGGTNVQTAMPNMPTVMADPAEKGKIKSDKDGKYKQAQAPTVKAPMINQPMYTALNQLGM